MSESAYTRCPGCNTVFRVTTEQLALREGQVRCGRCRAVFDANDHLVKAGADTSAKEDPAPEHPKTLQAPTPAEAPSDEPAKARFDEDATAPGDGTPTDAIPSDLGPSDATASATTPSGALPPPRDYEWRPRKRLREQPKALHALALVALVALLAAQLLFEYRDALAAHLPITRPLLDAACGVAQCEIAPLRDASALSIEASDLRADPAHKGLLELTATVRNRAAYPIAFPYLELTLTDASDGIVARRAFPPAAYVPAHGSGIAGNGELVVSMFLDASATAQAGYRLYLFYP
jgi:predicted Zn finger-like uncharacterized protein